jgi:hypothetical protein
MELTGACNMKNNLFSLMMAAALILSACASPTAVGTTQPSSSDQVATMVAATMQALPTKTLEPNCLSPIADSLLLRNEEDGYCILYPEGYIVVYPIAGEICLVPGEPYMACHNMHLMIEVGSADGSTASQVADGLLAQFPELAIQRSDLVIAGEEATMLDNYPGVDLLRLVLIVHDDRLYRLTFMRGVESGSEEMAKLDVLHTTVINSFTFLP